MQMISAFQNAFRQKKGAGKGEIRPNRAEKNAKIAGKNRNLQNAPKSPLGGWGFRLLFWQIHN
jgi:hypothetical protein